MKLELKIPYFFYFVSRFMKLLQRRKINLILLFLLFFLNYKFILDFYKYILI